MNAFLVSLDAAALLVIWWSAYAALHGGHRVDTWNGVVLNAALIAMKVCALVAAIATLYSFSALPWRARGVVYPGAVIAGWLYNYRFGIARHVRMAGGGIRSALHFRRGGHTR